MKFVPLIPLLLDSNGMPQLCYPMNSYDIDDEDAMMLTEAGLGFIEREASESTIQNRTSEPTSTINKSRKRKSVPESGLKRRGSGNRRNDKGGDKIS